MDYVKVILMDFPHGIHGITIREDTDCYSIYINARMSHEMQKQAYDHEMGHIDNQDFDEMYSVGSLEALRHDE